MSQAQGQRQLTTRRNTDLVEHLVVEQRSELLGLGVLEAHGEALRHLLVDVQAKLQRLGAADLVELAEHDGIGLELGGELLEILLGEVCQIAELVDRAIHLPAADQRQLLPTLERLDHGIANITAGIPFNLRERDLWPGQSRVGRQHEGSATYQRQRSSHSSLRCASTVPARARSWSIHPTTTCYPI